MRAPRLATTVELAFALLSWLGKRIHGKRPPSRSFICLHAWSGHAVTSVSLTALHVGTLVRRRRLSRADVALHVHLGTFRV